MRLALHACSIALANVVVDAQTARDCGYDGIELWWCKLERYLDMGYSIADLKSELGRVKVIELSPLEGFEQQGTEARAKYRRQSERMALAAKELGCPSIQAIALNGLEGCDWPEMRTKTAERLAEYADVAACYGIKVALEPVVVAPLRTLSQALEVTEEADRENIGIVVDLFHLWAAGTIWDEIAALDKRLVINAHIGDANPPKTGVWSDDDRGALPGDGVAPLKDGIAALRSTGYDDWWTVEVYSPRHWEWHPVRLASDLKRRMEALLK